MNDREQAWGLLTEFTQSESLRRHALAVEACMRAYARKLGSDENLWGAVAPIARLRLREVAEPG
jgi:predicted hydrolase (HD superfamily)